LGKGKISTQKFYLKFLTKRKKYLKKIEHLINLTKKGGKNQF